MTEYLWPLARGGFVPGLTGKALLEWLVERREKAGLTQTEVARRTKAMGERLGISQPYLSQIENGDRSLADLGPAKMEALRQLYRIDPVDWVMTTGLEVVTRPTEDAKPRSAARMGYRNIPRTPIPLDDALLKAAELYGEQPGMEGLRGLPWQRYLNDQPYKEGERPQTPKEWRDVFVYWKDRIDPPPVEE